MKRFLTLALAGVLALGLASTAYANVCAIDVVPAATLLFPFVEYDYEAGLAGNTGATTLFAITNVSNVAQIVHVTLWTDYSIAILDFNIIMTGYDVQTINIRDILRDGMLPYEGTGTNLPGEANIWEEANWGFTGTTMNPPPSPVDDGPFSSSNELYGGALDGWFVANGLPDPQPTWDGNVIGDAVLDCDPAVWDSSPNWYADNLPIQQSTRNLFRTYLEASMTADRWYAGCTITAGPPLNSTVANVSSPPDSATDALDTSDYQKTPWWVVDTDRNAWMYITADVVGACNKDLPDTAIGAAAYFGTSGNGITHDNVLMGDVMWVDPADTAGGINFSEGDNAVHLESWVFPAPAIWAPIPADDNDLTSFYARYHVASATLNDFREPLPTVWGLRYLEAPDAADAANTFIRTWKGSTNQAKAQDLNNGTYSLPPAPDDFFANSCTPYTYYAWDEDENVISVEGGFVPPWSGEEGEPLPIPNLFPLETQEVDADQFFLVDLDADGTTFGWLMFIWPRSNTTDFFGTTGAVSDQYQTWMGVKYQAFGNSSAAFSGAVLGNYNCFGTISSIPVINFRNQMISE